MNVTVTRSSSGVTTFSWLIILMLLVSTVLCIVAAIYANVQLAIYLFYGATAIGALLFLFFSFYAIYQYINVDVIDPTVPLGWGYLIGQVSVLLLLLGMGIMAGYATSLLSPNTTARELAIAASVLIFITFLIYFIYIIYYFLFLSATTML